LDDARAGLPDPRQTAGTPIASRSPSPRSQFRLLRYYAGQSPEWRARSYAGWAGAGDATAREHRTLGDLMVDLGERLRSLPAAGAYGAWLSDAFTAGTQREYPQELRYQRYIRLPNSSARFEPDEGQERLRCVVRSGPIDRPQTETAVALNSEARPIVDWRQLTMFSDVSPAARSRPSTFAALGYAARSATTWTGTASLNFRTRPA
jgi:hypothetical protein